MSCQQSVSLGVYVLGALEPGERSAVERHLIGCPFCQQELVRFAPLPGLLGRISLDDLATLEDEHTEPGPRERASLFAVGPSGREPNQSVSRHMVPEQHRAAATSRPRVGRRRKTGRRHFVLPAAGIVVAVAISVVLVQQSLTASPTGPVIGATWKAIDATTKVTASANLTDQLWGTGIVLNMQNLPKDQVCQLVVHNRNGKTQSAGWWRNGQETEGNVPASTSFDRKEIDRLDVVTADNRLLVDLNPDKS
jgi:hypothetical protein